MAAATAGAAVLANPDKFAKAAKTAVEALGGAIDNVGKAIGVLKQAQALIVNTKSDCAVIVNCSGGKGEWYCYNDIAPVKLNTQFRSYMGAYTAVQVHCPGWGAMALFKDNKQPHYTVMRNSTYLFDGENLTMFLRDQN